MPRFLLEKRGARAVGRSDGGGRDEARLGRAQRGVDNAQHLTSFRKRKGAHTLEDDDDDDDDDDDGSELLLLALSLRFSKSLFERTQAFKEASL